MPLCLSLPFTATGPAEMLTVPEVGLQGLYIGKNPQPPPQPTTPLTPALRPTPSLSMGTSPNRGS